jgi:hypothetical protein
MSKIVSGVLLLTPGILGAFLVISPVGIAAESQKEITETPSQVTETEVVDSPPPEHSGNSLLSQRQEAPTFTGFSLATGSNLANSNAGTAVSSNAYGLEGTFRISQNFAIDGWVGYANQRYIGKGDAAVWNWAVGVTFPDLGKRGSIAGIVVGMEPRVTSVTSGVNLGLGNGVADRDTSMHVEGFYKYHLSDNIEITPGVIWLTAPNHNEDNEDIYIGVIRTVFRF